MASAAHRITLAEGWSLWRLSALRSAGMPVDWLDWFAVGDDDAVSAEDARAISAQAVRDIVRQPLFVEAVTWQNASLVSNWLGRYAADLGSSAQPSLSRRDQREALVAFLVQRYCAKNETIGFFGPVSWSRFDEEHDGLTVSGSGGIRHRSTFLEHWAARAIADAMERDPQVEPDLIARLHPAYAVRGGTVCRPGRRPIPLDRQALAALGTIPARVGSLDQEASERLRLAGILLVGLPIPVGSDPLTALRDFAAGLPAPWSDRIAGFALRLDIVHAAAGDPAKLRTALESLDACFRELAGRPAARRDKPASGHGRAIVYQDARRDTDVRIGADVLAGLRRPLAVLLDSARWFVSELGTEVERDLRSRYRTLCAGGRAVSLSDLVLAAGDVLNAGPDTAVHRVAADFTARWAEILRLGAGEPIRVDVAATARLARALFPPQPIRWRAAVQHSPDLLLADTGPPGRPQLRWVLGELHMALNTLENRPFVTQADDVAELRAATAADHPADRIVPIYPHDGPEVTSRTYPPLAMDLPDRYAYWSYGRDDGHPAGVPSLPGAGLDIIDDGARLLARGPDGRQAAVLEFLGEFLTALAVNRFRLRPPARHLPRLLFDEVVVARESWHLPVAEIPAGAADYQHRDLRAWLAGQGMPRHMFVRTPGAPKPFLVDLRSPLSLRNLARLVRAVADPAALTDFVEMFPGPSQTWLTDDRGYHYTTEFRLVAVDEHMPAAGSCPPAVSREST